MAVIGNLATTLSVNTTGLTAGLTSAGKSFQNFGSGITGVVGKFGPLAAGITGIAGAAGFGMLVRSSFDALDALGKMADTLGVTTEALAGLQRAGERAGVASDAMSKGIARMQKTLSIAADRGGTAADNIRALGLDIRRLHGLSADEQFLQIAESINSVGNSADRTRLAMEVFGREGTGMLKVVSRGTEEARKEFEKARALGLAPSREEVAQIEIANDAIADMRAAFSGVANVVAVEVAPMLTGLAERVTGFVTTARSGFGQVRQFAVDTFATVEFGVTRAADHWELFTMRLGLLGLRFYEDMRQMFVVNLPRDVAWLVDNAGNLFETFGLATEAFFLNLSSNIGSIMRELWKFISTGGKHAMEISWTPLLEGFVSTVEPVPERLERVMSDTEKMMEHNIARLSARINEGLGEHLLKRREDWLPDISGMIEQKMAEIDLDAEITGQFKQDDLKGAKALTRGSSEAFSAVLSAMRGSGKDPAEDTAANTKAILEEQKRATQELRRMARQKPVELIAGTV